MQNITAGTFTIDNSTEAVFVDNVSAANSENIGTVILNSGRHVAINGNASTFNALTVNAKTDVDVRVNLTTDTGDLILNADTDSTGGADRIFFGSDPTLTSAGDITLNSSSGAPGIDASGSITMLAGGTINVNDDFTAGNNATLSADNGINVNGDFTAGKIINLDGDANSSVDGNDTITILSGVTVAATGGGLTLGQSVALGSITLNARDGITLNGDFTSNGATTIDADTGVAFGTGTFAVASGATLNTNNNTLSINALDIDLQGNVNAGSSDVAISLAQPASGNQGQIILGDNTSCPACTMQISGAELQNITAGTFTIDNSTEAIFVDNISAANSDNIGTVILTSGRHVGISGNASTFNALTVNAKTDVDIRVNLTTDTGDLILNADTDSTGGVDRIFFGSDPTLTSAGDISLNSSSGAPGIDASGSITMLAGGTINVNDDFTAGNDATLSADNGINVNGDFTAGKIINLDGDANSSVDGNDTITFADGVTLASTGDGVTLGQSVALGSITLNARDGITLNGDFTSNGTTTIDADTGVAFGTGTFAVASGATLNTNNNTLSINALDIELQGNINAGSSNVSITVSNNGAISLGNATGGLNLSGSEIQNISAASLTIGTTSNGNVSVDGVSGANSDNIGTVILNSGGDISFNNNDSVFNALTLNANNDINVNTNLETDTGNFAAVADADLNSAGDFNLGTGTTLTSANDIDVTSENVTLNGNLVAGGTITVNGTVVTGGGITIQAVDGITLTNDVFNNGDITIDADTDRNGVGDFEIVAGKIVKSFNNNITITANDFIISGLIDAGTGTLTLLSSVAGSTIGLGNAAGSIVISGAELQNITASTLNVGSTLNSGVAVDGVTLADLVNIGSVSLNSGGAVDFSGAASTFKTLNVGAAGSINVDVALSTSTSAIGFVAGGDINVNADLTSATTSVMHSGGSISTTAATITATILNVNAATGINISTQSNQLGFSNTGSGDVVISNAGALTMSGQNNAGNLSVITSGSLTQYGFLVIGGDASFNAGVNDINLFGGTANIFSGAVSVTGNNVVLTNANGIDLGASTVTGNFDLTVGGAVTQSGALTVSGTSNVNAVGFDVTLDNAANDFNGTVTAAAANVTLVDSDDITLGASTVTGALSVTAADGITVDGAVATSGLTSFNADSDNNSNGSFSVTALGSLQTNNNDLSIISRDIDLQGTVDAGAGNVLLSISGTGQVMLGDDTSCPTCAMKISGAELQNITAGTLTVDNSTEAIFVDNISAANSDNIGTVILTSGRHVAFNGTASTFNALSVNAKAEVDVRVNLTTDTGDLTLNADTDSTSGTDRIFFAVDPTLTSAGDITLNSSSGAPGIDASGSISMLAGGTINVNDDFTAGNNATLSADNGINVNGEFTAGKIINLDGDANSSADGNDTVTLANGITIESTTGNISFDSAASALGSISVLAANGIDVNDAFASSGSTVFNSDSDANGTGTFTVAATGSVVTNDNTLSITADDIDLQGTLNADTSNITILVSDGGTIGLGNTAGGLTISGSELQNITSANLILGSATSGNVTVDGITAANSDNIGTVTLNSAGAVEFFNNDSIFNALTVGQSASIEVVAAVTTDTGALNFNSAGDIEVTFATSATTMTLISGGNIRTSSGKFTATALTTVSQMGTNIFTDVDSINFTNGAGGNVVFRNFDKDLVVEGTDGSGSTVIFAKTITQSGALDIAGLAWLSTNFSGGGDINLTHAGNVFGGRVLLRGGNVALVAASAIDLTGDITGNLDVTAGGAVTNSQSLVVDGTTTISAVGHDVTLDFVSNDFTGAVSVTGANVSLADTNAIDLGASTVTGNLDVTADGSVSDSGPLSVAGTTNISVATGEVITLNNAANDFTGAVSVSGLHVVIFDANDLEMGASTVTGNIQLVSGGSITQSGALVINGGSTLNAAQDITLTNAANDFAGVSMQGINVSIVDSNDIQINKGFDSSNITGNFSLTAGGDVTQGLGSGLNVAGMTSIDATGFDINLGIAGSAFLTGSVSLNGNNVTLRNRIALDLGASAISGNLDVTSEGAVTQSGSLAVSGTTNINAAGFDITLDNVANDFTDDVSVSGNNVSLVNSRGTHLGASTITGNFMITVDSGDTLGYLVQSGALTVAGTTMIDTSGNIVLVDAGNDFAGEVGIDGLNATISDMNSITLKDSTLSSRLEVYANDGVTINGVISTSITSQINADNDADGSGLFSITAAGSFVTGTPLFITAVDIDLVGTINAASDVFIRISDNGTIGLGNTAGDMTIDGSELQNISASRLILGTTTNGNVTVDGISAANSDNIDTVTINSGGNIDFSNNDSVFNALNVHAVTDINVNTNLETDTGSFVAVADFELNNVGDFNLGTGTILTSAVDIDITAENVNLNGDMVAGGTITINGEIFADDPIFLYAVDGIIITEDINNNESITIDADTNRDGIGDFELVGGVMIKSNDYDISITANDLIIDGIIDAGLGNVTLVSSVGGTIGVGEAWGHIRIDNSELQNITAGNLIIGDEINSNVYVKNVQAVDVANISELTLNATKWGKSVFFYGPASDLNDLTVNAANDVRVYGGLTAKDTTFNAGDDVKLWGGNFDFDSLTAVADDDISIYGTLDATTADLTAGDDIWLDGYQTYGTLNATAGDDITIDWELTAATATLNAGDDVRIYGTTQFGNLTVTATDDISIHGDQQTTGTATLNAGDDINLRNSNSFGSLDASAGDDIHSHGTLSVTNDGNLSAGDDIHLHGNNSFGGDLNALAADDIHLHGLLNVSGDGNLDAGDDIHLHGDNSFGGDLNVDAGDDIHSHGLLAVGGDGNLAAGDDIHLHGNNSFGGSLFAAANGDIRSHGDLAVTGSSFMSAGDDIYMNGQFNSGAWTAIAGDDIRLRGAYNISTADLKANDEIRIDRASINSGNFFAEADYDNNGSGAFQLKKHSSINSTGDIDLSGYGLKIKGDLSAAGTITLTDKSE